MSPELINALASWKSQSDMVRGNEAAISRSGAIIAGGSDKIMIKKCTEISSMLDNLIVCKWSFIKS